MFMPPILSYPFGAATAALQAAMILSDLDRLLSLKAKGDLRSSRWSNDDIIPLPPCRRTWGFWSFVSFWAINNLCPTTFTVGSTLIGIGLAVWQAMIAVIIGRIIILLVAVFNGWIGAEWHIGFPVISRCVWGMHGSYLIIAQRILLSCVWMACQAWTGGLCVSAVLSAVFPSYHHMKNSMSPGTHMDTKQFVGFTIFCFMSCFLIWIPPEKTKHILYICNAISFITMLGIMSWAISTAGGTGPLMSQSPSVSGSYKTGWGIVQGVTSVIGSIAVGLTNQPDYSRFARRLNDQIGGQIYSILVFGTMMPLFGCITASATQKIYGEVIWNPPLIVSRWLDTGYTSHARAGAFFAGSGLIVAQLAINTIDNAFSGGMDFAGLFPRYLNIRRGSYLTLFIAILIQPWQLLSSASVFISVLSAYGVFLGPMIGIMITDYWIVRNRKMKLSDLYTPDSTSMYWYYHGVNFRAYIAWIVGFAPLLPGFIAHINSSITVSRGATNLYYLAFPAGLLSSGTVYLVICTIWPVEGVDAVDRYDVFQSFTEEERGKLGMEGVSGIVPPVQEVPSQAKKEVCPQVTEFR